MPFVKESEMRAYCDETKMDEKTTQTRPILLSIGLYLRRPRKSGEISIFQLLQVDIYTRPILMADMPAMRLKSAWMTE